MMVKAVSEKLNKKTYSIVPGKRFVMASFHVLIAFLPDL
jgi:hypothetical protein